MEITFLWALILALIAPIVWAFSNVLDKYVVSHRIRNAKIYTGIAAIVYVLIGLAMGALLDWGKISLWTAMFPALSGIFFGIVLLVYFTIMQKEDPSHVEGMSYIYPLIVAFLSFMFLGEKLSWIGYLGAMLTILGALMLSARIREIKLRASLWMIAVMIIFMAFYEFFLKLAADNLSIMHGLAINEFFAGITVMFIFFRKDVRRGFFKEIGKIKWAFLSEGIILISIAMAYASLIVLPVAFVSSVATIQPLAVLILEGYAHKYFGKMRRDHMTRKKLIAISVMVLGIILLYVSAPSL